jgi:hypothetical protein
LEGATHDTEPPVLENDAATPVGAVGAVIGDTLAENDDQAEAPIELRAKTRNLYAVPFVSPEKLNGLETLERVVVPVTPVAAAPEAASTSTSYEDALLLPEDESVQETRTAPSRASETTDVGAEGAWVTVTAGADVNSEPVCATSITADHLRSDAPCGIGAVTTLSHAPYEVLVVEITDHFVDVSCTHDAAFDNPIEKYFGAGAMSVSVVVTATLS